MPNRDLARVAVSIFHNATAAQGSRCKTVFGDRSASWPAMTVSARCPVPPNYLSLAHEFVIRYTTDNIVIFPGICSVAELLSSVNKAEFTRPRQKAGPQLQDLVPGRFLLV